MSDAVLGSNNNNGLHVLYHGEEAVVHVPSFSMEGRAIRKVRQSANRLRAARYRVEVLHPREIGPDLRTQLEQIAWAWRRDQAAEAYLSFSGRSRS